MLLMILMEKKILEHFTKIYCKKQIKNKTKLDMRITDYDDDKYIATQDLRINIR